MNQYLRSVGFSKIRTKKELREILHDVVTGNDSTECLHSDTGVVMMEYRKKFAGPCGIILRGDLEEEKNLTMDFYYPYISPSNVTTEEDLTIERHIEKNSFAGVAEDLRVGVSLIFYLINEIGYMSQVAKGIFQKTGNAIKLSALSTNGTVLLPIKKNAKELAKIKQATIDRNQRIVAAREGNEKAIESLTIEDIDTYSVISKRILKEDLFSLVDTYFMPYGVECDQYSIMATIEEVNQYTNYYTDEEIYVLTLNCNEIIFDVCINKEDLLGEPEAGRRFKGTIWLQGEVEFCNS